jgi:hypothetical protein
MSLPVFTDRRVQHLAERALVGGLGRRGRRRLARALAASERDRAAYHALVQLFLALESRPLLSQSQHERILDAACTRAMGRDGREPSPLLRRLAPAMALVVLVAVGALVIPRELGPVARRGLDRVPGSGQVGLRAVCIRDGKVVPPPARTAGVPVEARCRLSDELQLVVTHNAGYAHLLVVGHQPDEPDPTRWYYPVPPTGRSAPAPQGVTEEVLGEAIRLSVNHRPGPLRLLALFSNSTLEADSVVAWLGALREGERFEELRQRLGADGLTTVELYVIIDGESP